MLLLGPHLVRVAELVLGEFLRFPPTLFTFPLLRFGLSPVSPFGAIASPRSPWGRPLSGPAILVGALVGVGAALAFSLKKGESGDSDIRMGA